MRKEKPLIDGKALTLDEWLGHVLIDAYKREVSILDCQFPTDKHRDDFLGKIDQYPDSTIKNLLRSFLIPSGTLGIDSSTRDYVMSMDNAALTDLMETNEFVRRLIEPPFLPWEGVTWILDLLPHYPIKALDALDAFFVAHCQYLPDGRIHGLADSEAIIRKRYMQRENPREALLALRPNEFEHLIGVLYEKMGFKVQVTPSSRDGGVDIEAHQTATGGQASIFIQCKKYEDVVRVQAIRELMGVVSRRQANKGVVVATSRFTKPAQNEASATPMIELIDFTALNLLLNRHLGAKWPDTMHYEIRRMQMESAKQHARQ